MPIQPYLFFNGRADEAIEFYRKALGAEVGMKMRFSENPDRPPPARSRQGRTTRSCMRRSRSVRTH